MSFLSASQFCIRVLIAGKMPVLKALIDLQIRDVLSFSLFLLSLYPLPSTLRPCCLCYRLLRDHLNRLNADTLTVVIPTPMSCTAFSIS